MPQLTRAPSPEQFANAWTRNFAVALKAAGSDGRITRAQIKKIAGRDDALQLWADNALDYLQAKDQESVKIDKLLASGYAYANNNARRVAGNGGRVSLVEAHRMAKDLRRDFRALRGKSVAGEPELAGATLAKACAKAFSGVLYMSEADYPYTAASFASDRTGPITKSEMKALLGTDTIDSISKPTGFFDGYDPDYNEPEDAAKFKKLEKLMKANLTNLAWVAADPESTVEGRLFLLGRDGAGNVVGLATTRIWT